MSSWSARDWNDAVVPKGPFEPLSAWTLRVDGKVRSLRPTFVAVFILELLETATIGTLASSW